jgi:hypothetical protein
MKTRSPWFQTAALMSAIRHAICNLEAARRDGPLDSQPIGADWNGALRRHPEARLTDSHLMDIAGKRDQLAGILKQKYGYAQEQAEHNLGEFLPALIPMTISDSS